MTRPVKRVQMKAPAPFRFPKNATATGFQGGGVASGHHGGGWSPPGPLPGTGYVPGSQAPGQSAGVWQHDVDAANQAMYGHPQTNIYGQPIFDAQGNPTNPVAPEEGSGGNSAGGYGPAGLGYIGMPWVGPSGVMTTIGNSGYPKAIATGSGSGSPALDSYNGFQALANAGGPAMGAGQFRGFQLARHGAVVPGERKPGDPHDTVPAMLDPGEVILNQKEQGNVKPTGRLPGEIAAQLYAARKAKHFAKGGVSGDHWIQGAVKHPGAFTASAKRAGKSVHEYAVEKQHAGGTLGRRARLALTFERMRK